MVVLGVVMMMGMVATLTHLLTGIKGNSHCVVGDCFGLSSIIHNKSLGSLFVVLLLRLMWSAMVPDHYCAIMGFVQLLESVVGCSVSSHKMLNLRTR